MDTNIREKTLDDWIEQVRATVREIHTHHYFLDRWMTVEHKKPLHACTKAELLEPFQRFWELLPDKPAIRVHPFYQVCDLAEEYCFGEDE